jgi:outer membrane lipoprotein-sorting protein
MAKPSSAVAALLAVVAICWAAVASGADGTQIFQEAARRDAGYGDYTSNVTMILNERGGSSIVRKMQMSNLEAPGEGSRTLVLFETPADVKGTTVLTATHASRDDEQWIYLPAFQRVKQISTANQTAAFMGSEFSYEDVNSINIQLAKFTYAYLRDEVLDGLPCFVVQRVPKYDHSAYSREVVWLDTRDYVIRRVDYFDRDNKPFKTLTGANYEKYLDRYYRPKQMTMVNLQNGKSTVLQVGQYRFRSGLRDSDFDVSAMKK